MATIVCQGLQPCLESQILEPRTIRLKLSYSIGIDNEKQICSTADDDSHCLSFLQANSRSKLDATDKETVTTYVHPHDNRSKSTLRLSDKSLELCTENLGSETGTYIIEDDIFSEIGGRFYTRREQQKMGAAKKVIARNFPPPLTTICGVISFQVSPHREDGRLIIKATKAPSTHYSVFQAERSHGRLRLSLFNDFEEEEIENVAAAVSCGDGEEEEEEEEGDFDEENDGYMGEEEVEGVNGNNRNIGGKMGIKKFQWAGRCKDGEPEKKKILIWKALWVATS